MYWLQGMRSLIASKEKVRSSEGFRALRKLDAPSLEDLATLLLGLGGENVVIPFTEGRRHSWIKKPKGELIETTEHRELYFGASMTGNMAVWFHETYA